VTPTFQTYYDFERYMRRAHDPGKGRAAGTTARVHRVAYDPNMDNVTYGVTVHDEHIFNVSPDDTLEFVASYSAMDKLKFTLAAVLHKLVPICTERRNRSSIVWSCGSPMTVYFPGMKFNLRSGGLLNPGPQWIVNVDARTEYLRLRRDWSRGVKLREKMGVIAALIDEVAEHVLDKRMVDAGESVGVDTLCELLRTNTHPTEFYKQVIQSLYFRYWRHRSPTPEEVTAKMQSLLDVNSQSIRIKLGVLVLDNQGELPYGGE
jgi:hypothetical protein